MQAGVEGYPEAGFSFPLDNRITRRNSAFSGAMENGYPISPLGDRPFSAVPRKAAEEVDISRKGGQLSRHVVPPADPKEPPIYRTEDYFLGDTRDYSKPPGMKDPSKLTQARPLILSVTPCMCSLFENEEGWITITGDNLGKGNINDIQVTISLGGVEFKCTDTVIGQKPSSDKKKPGNTPMGDRHLASSGLEASFTKEYGANSKSEASGNLLSKREEEIADLLDTEAEKSSSPPKTPNCRVRATPAASP